MGKCLSIVLALGLLTATAGPLHAFVHDLTIAEKSEISQFPDDKLIDTYIDVIVEIEASRTFHQTSGFTPKDYASHKSLLRYRIMLLIEMKKRNLEPPPVE